jgi:hypothetical protein
MFIGMESVSDINIGSREMRCPHLKRRKKVEVRRGQKTKEKKSKNKSTYVGRRGVQNASITRSRKPCWNGDFPISSYFPSTFGITDAKEQRQSN